MKSLPIGFQSIEDIITQGFTYVDKTGILHGLVKEKGYYFLSRPRRFGKSLTCSTLEAIFRGRKELFDGLEINKLNYNWKVYPVVRLDFSEIDHDTTSELTQSLLENLHEIAETYNVKIKSKLLKTSFKELVVALAKKYGPVAIIIDEYDKPILDHIHDAEMAIKMRTLLKNFYGALKGKDIDANLRFLFLTGVSKFSKVSIFSELNNLQDLTLDERAADLCGYTQKELELVFDEHIQQLAKHIGKDKKATLTDLKYWYNGFQFSKNGCKVYNPFSILNCLGKRDFTNYWFSSGTPTFIMKFIEKDPEKIEEIIKLEAERLSVGQMDKLSVESYFQDMVLLFLQAGYLTIANFDEKSQIYQLSYPNYEVRLSMTDQILGSVANIKSVKLAGFIVRFKDALQEDNIEAFCSAMQDFFTLLPHTVIIDREKFYQGIFFTVTKLIGAEIDAEHATDIGYIDAVLYGKKNTYIIEFKKDKSPDVALNQISDKKYFEKFKIEGKNLTSKALQGRMKKQIVLVGMSFYYDKKAKKTVTLKWKIKKKS
jgi:hypothetical protein